MSNYAYDLYSMPQRKPLNYVYPRHDEQSFDQEDNLLAVSTASSPASYYGGSSALAETQYQERPSHDFESLDIVMSFRQPTYSEHEDLPRSSPLRRSISTNSQETNCVGSSEEHERQEEHEGLHGSSPLRPSISTNSQETNCVGSSDEQEGQEEHEGGPPSPRTPFYLRRWVFFTFAILFGTLMLAVEVLVNVSLRRNGIHKGDITLRYLWSYGATGLLTIIAAVWSRVEYEAHVLAPWTKADPIAMSKDALLIDYVSSWKPVVPFRALKRRDYCVASVSTISLLLNVLVVLSTGVLVLDTVEVLDYAIPISLETRFVDDPQRLQNVSLLSKYVLEALNPDMDPRYDTYGLKGSGLKYPRGLSDQFVFQSFSTDSPDVQELSTTVDAISFGFECDEAVIQINGHKRTRLYQDNSTIIYETPVIEIDFLGCKATFALDPGVVPGQPMISYQTILIHPWNSLTQCESWKRKDARWIGFVYMEMEFAIYNKTASVSQMKYNLSVCTPTYEYAGLDVVLNATAVRQTTRRYDASPMELSNIHAWDILEACFQSILGTGVSVVYYDVGNATIYADSASSLVLVSECKRLCPDVSSLSNSALLKVILSRYFEKFAAILLRQSIMEQVNVTSMGTSKKRVVRLFVQPIPGHAIAAILALCVALLVILLLLPLQTIQLGVEPGSMIATAYLSGSGSAVQFPRSFGAMDQDKLAQAIDQNRRMETTRSRPGYSGYSVSLHDTDLLKSSRPLYKRKTSSSPRMETTFSIPTALRRSSMVFLFIILTYFAAALEITLRISDSYNGLGDVQDSTYLHYLWTAFPTAILALLSVWLSAVDFQVRVWAPYMSLARAERGRSSLYLDLVRPLIPVVLHREYQIRNFMAFTITASALLGSVYTTASAPLFRVMTVPTSTQIELITESLFVPVVNRTSHVIRPTFPTTSLILESNLSYTALAYENLVLPSFTLKDPLTTNGSQASDTSNILVYATVPAMRPGLSCRRYPPSDISTSIVNGSLSPGFQHPSLYLNVSVKGCADLFVPLGGSINKNAVDMPFGFSSEGTSSKYLHYPCNYTEFFYAWGRLNPSTDSSENKTWVVGCNGTIDTVDVAVTFRGPLLGLEKDNAIEVLDQTVRPLVLNSPISQQDMLDVYRNAGPILASLPPPSNAILDLFFQLLLTSRHAIPPNSLVDSFQTYKVENSILLQHGIIAAQYISSNFRVQYSNTSSSNASNVTFPALSSSSHDAMDSGIYNATAIDQYGSRRLVQDAVATRVVEVLLLATAILTMLAWRLGGQEPMPNRSPASVASVLAVLAGGSMLEYMYRDGTGDCLSLEDAQSRFGEGCRFRLGWGPLGPEVLKEEQRYGVWVVEDKASPVLRGHEWH